jgi:hypothetical protein
MNEATKVSGSPQLNARLEKIERVRRAGRDWQASLLKWGASRLEEDGSIVYSFPPRVSREVMEPFLAELSQRVEFRILGEYQALPRAETGHDQPDEFGPATQVLRIKQDARLEALPSGTRFNDGNVPHATSEPVSEENVEKNPSPTRSCGKAREKAKQPGVPEDIRASESFRKLTRNAQVILRRMYGFSHFDGATSRRTCQVSRNGLAELLRVTPRTVTNAWNNLERSFLVMRLKRGYRNAGVSVFELPYNYSHVCLWRMEAGSKKRY